MKMYEKPELDLIRFTGENVLLGASKLPPVPDPLPGETPFVPNF